MNRDSVCLGDFKVNRASHNTARKRNDIRDADSEIDRNAIQDARWKVIIIRVPKQSKRKRFRTHGARKKDTREGRDVV